MFFSHLGNTVWWEGGVLRDRRGWGLFSLLTHLKVFKSNSEHIFSMSNLLLFQTTLFWPDEKVPFYKFTVNRIRIIIWIRIHFESGSRSKTYTVFWYSEFRIRPKFRILTKLRIWVWGLDPHTAYFSIPRFFMITVEW
jgi:hypothetical protein